MKSVLFATTLSFGLAPMTTTAFGAGIIEGACLSSERRAVSQTLCSCIQSVADQRLTPSEQRKGAVFFKDPHKSQEMRQSPSEADSVFWLKWIEYGETAAKACQ